MSRKKSRLYLCAHIYKRISSMHQVRYVCKCIEDEDTIVQELMDIRRLKANKENPIIKCRFYVSVFVQ